MYFTSLIATLALSAGTDASMDTDDVSIDVTVGAPVDGSCAVALDLSDVDASPGTFVVVQEDPAAGSNILLPVDMPGFESGVCNGASAYGGVESCTYGLSGVGGVDWTVDLDAPSGFSAVHIVDVEAGEEVARVQVGCTCFDYGDFDADGVVGVKDLQLFLGATGAETPVASNYQQYDAPESLTGVPQDGVIDTTDLLAFLTRYAQSCD